MQAFQTGLRQLASRCDRVLIAPADVSLFSADTVRALSGSGCPLARPVCEGVPGYPLLVSREMIPSLLEYDGEGGLDTCIQACRAAPVPVADPGIHVRVARSAIYRAMPSAREHAGWRPLVKLQIARDSAFLGPGSRQLLSLIEATGSVSTASKQMGLSYSKAWKILNHLEEQTGCRVLCRQQGGKNGGETHLTEQGRGLLEQFERFEQECRAAVTQIFEKHYGNHAAPADNKL